jgi:hypothetical protein
MRTGMSVVAIAASCGLCMPALAQSIVNGDFETGDLTGWTVANTANGVGAPGTVTMIDIDAAGPLGVSNAATFNVGQLTFMSGVWEGIEMTQRLDLQAGVPYTFDFDWLAKRESATNNAQGGRFELIVDGVVIATANAGPTTGTTPIPGHLTAPYTPTATGNPFVGVRITRPFQPGGLLFQYVDNFTIGGGGPAPCYANCDESTVAPVLNVQDFTCFLQRYAAGESYANCDESTVAPTLNVQDFTCFLQSYAAGCP